MHTKEYIIVLGLSTMGLLITLFIILNILSTIIIIAACVVSGRASRAIDPDIEAKMVSQRELAIAVSKLRVINPQPVSVTNMAGRHLVFSSANQQDAIGAPVDHPTGDHSIAASRA